MRRTTGQITLGGVTYTIHTFTLGELERVGALQEDAAASGKMFRFALGLVRIALERADPKVETPDAIEAGVDEINAACEVIRDLAGLIPRDTTADPQRAAA